MLCTKTLAILIGLLRSLLMFRVADTPRILALFEVDAVEFKAQFRGNIIDLGVF